LKSNIVEASIKLKSNIVEVLVDLKPNVNSKDNIVAPKVSKLLDNEVYTSD
jgi:hypothetical protein